MAASIWLKCPSQRAAHKYARKPLAQLHIPERRGWVTCNECEINSARLKIKNATQRSPQPGAQPHANPPFMPVAANGGHPNGSSIAVASLESQLPVLGSAIIRSIRRYLWDAWRVFLYAFTSAAKHLHNRFRFLARRSP